MNWLVLLINNIVNGKKLSRLAEYTAQPNIKNTKQNEIGE